jgi:uncharacterized membrane protein/thiol-disulfide isomerase/thioredoxin
VRALARNRRPTLRRWLASILFLSLLSLLPPPPALAGSPIVRAILFYSPTCPHCHKVLTEDLPPLLDEYGDQLQIVAVDVSTSGGQQLYRATIEQFDIPGPRQGVPTLVVGPVVLVGDVEIPEQLPGLIEAGLAQGGVDWPNIPGLQKVIGEIPVEAASPPATPTDIFLRDPVGNSLSTLVLAGMVISLGFVGVRLVSRRKRRPSTRWPAAIPYLAVVGAGVAGYLAFIEWSGDPATCGPIGDCNAVQASPASVLFGFIPVAWLGFMTYAAIFVAWFYGRRAGGRTGTLAAQAILVLALVGTAFSIYLTFLEPFVIGATCIWCLASAVTMTSILWAASSAPGRLFPERPHRASPNPNRSPTT